MAYMQVSSSNPAIGHVLKKNPASGMTLRSNRRGTLFGWYSPGSSTEYNCWFSDADNEISYPENEANEFEYLNLSRYCSSLFPLNVLSTFFNDATAKQLEEDVPAQQLVTIGMIRASSYSQKTMKFFSEHLKEYGFTATELAPQHYRIDISHAGTMYSLLNTTALFSFMMALANQEEFFMEEQQLAKMIECANKINAPYFVRYMIKRNAVRSREIFSRMKPLLETPEIALTHGDTFMSRLDFVHGHMRKDMSLVDFGCGEGRYGHLAGKINADQFYVGIDKDEYLVNKTRLKLARKGFDNAQAIVASDWDFELPERKHAALLTEVLEHMTVEEGITLLSKIQKDERVDRIVITMPNISFNSNFLIENYRHPDHVWEPTEKDFELFIRLSVLPGWSYETSAIGDKVSGCSVTLGAVLTRKETAWINLAS